MGIGTGQYYVVLFSRARKDDDPFDEDGLPSVVEILRRQPVHSQPELIDLTLDSSDEVST
jgi:hypothetical protein